MASAEIKRRLNDTVPQDQTGLISYDSYWEILQGNAVLRSVPEIREVIDVSKVVENRIQQAFTREALQPMARVDQHDAQSVYYVHNDWRCQRSCGSSGNRERPFGERNAKRGILLPNRGHQFAN